MANFECIGVPQVEPAEAEELIMAAADRAKLDQRGGGDSEHWLWRDPSGAALAFHLEGEEIACVTPFFVATDPARWTVHCEGATEDPECVHCSGIDCDVLDEGGELVGRASVQLLHYEPYESWLAEPRDFPIEVVAFAHVVDLFASEEELAASMTDELGEDGARFAENFFIPIGMFDEEPGGMLARARAAFAGRIERLEKRTNELAGGQFWHARVDSHPGPVDVVFSADASETPPEIGAILRAEGWLVARPAVRP